MMNHDSIETSDDELTRLLAERAHFQESRFSKNTIQSYGYDWKMFCAWCEARGRTPLPAMEETVSLYLTDLLSQGRKVSTVKRRNCAIIHQHRRAQLPSPVSKNVLELLYCARRQRGEKPRQMRALTLEQLRKISAALLASKGAYHRQWRGITTDFALRNRALIVVGFTSALRRCNIAGLLLSDVAFSEKGIVLTIHQEKQDQEGKGRLIGLPFGKHSDTCPVLVLSDWLKRRGNAPGPLFPRLDPKHKGEHLDGECIWRIVKKAVALIGLDPKNYGGHSLRSGFVTAAGEADIGILRISSHTGQSVQMVERYFRRQGADVFRNNACGAIDF